MPSEAAATLAHRRRKRVTAACDFCRRRKLGCDNAKPKCENCVAHGVTCSHTQRSKPQRPSNARINTLQEENVKLRDSLAKLNSQLTADDDDAPTVAGHDTTPGVPPTVPSQPLTSSSNLRHGHSRTSRPGREPLQSHPQSTIVREGNFHGPTSALFDDDSVRARPEQESHSAVDTQRKNQLLAEATRQRQMELVNLTSSKLDFDGADPELSMQLLSVFWNRQYHGGSVVHRPTFMRDMACGGPYFSKLLLNAMLWVASKDSPSHAPCQADSPEDDARGRAYRIKAEQIIKDSGLVLLFRSDITTIQALLLMSDSLFAWCDEKSLSWHYLGIAINMIIDLGIHVGGTSVKGSKVPAAEDLEVSRRVFWAAFVMDKIQSIYQGRPARLRENDNLVPIAFLDEYEELEQFHTLTYAYNPTLLACPTYAVSTFEQLCKLSVIIDRVLHNLYAEKSSTRSAGGLLDVRNTLYDDLKRWRTAVPLHLSVNSDDASKSTMLPHTLSLMSMYNSVIILLHRPFVSDGHLQSASGSAASDAFAACATAAVEIDSILRLYNKKFCMNTPPYFVSYATYVSATIHVRIAAQRETGSDAHKRLWNCLDILEGHQLKCRGPKRALRILKGLVRKLQVNMEAYSSPSELNAHGARGLNLRVQGEASGSMVDPDQSLVPESSTAGTVTSQGTVDVSLLDPMLTDIDIDEIMRTFDPTQEYSNAPQTQTYGAPIPLASNVDQTDGLLDGGWEDMDFLYLQDSLFGFDVSLTPPMDSYRPQ